MKTNKYTFSSFTPDSTKPIEFEIKAGEKLKIKKDNEDKKDNTESK